MTSLAGIEVEPLPALVMRRRGLAQLGQAHHRRILVPAVDHGLGGLAADILGAGIVGKALAEIDRAGLARELRHHLEDAGLKGGEDRVHGRLVVWRPDSGSARSTMPRRGDASGTNSETPL